MTRLREVAESMLDKQPPPEGTEPQFRAMTANDIDGVLSIERAVYHSPHSESFYRQDLQNNAATYLILQSDTNIVGYIGYWLVLDECSIIMVGVHPLWQGRGFGRKLMQRALSDAADAGATFSTLEVRDGNLPAINLYQSLGYEVVGRRKNYYKSTGDDALLMTLEPIA